MLRKSIFALCFLALVLVTGCYPMPQEGEYSVIPSTNNPSITRDKGQNNPLAPAMKM